MDHPTRIPSSRECVRADAARYSENVDDVSGWLSGRCASLWHTGLKAGDEETLGSSIRSSYFKHHRCCASTRFRQSRVCSGY